MQRINNNVMDNEAVWACRAAYKALFTHLPVEEAAEYVRSICKAWKSGNREDCEMQIGQAVYALSNVEGAWDGWWETRKAWQAFRQAP